MQDLLEQLSIYYKENMCSCTVAILEYLLLRSPFMEHTMLKRRAVPCRRDPRPVKWKEREQCERGMEM